MKKAVTLVIFLCWFGMASGQILNPKETAKRKATDRTNNAVDRTIDKGLDKVEEGISNLFKKKEKTNEVPGERAAKENSSTSNSTSTSSSSAGSGWDDPATNTPTNSTPATASTSAKLAANSKFDFIPGEKVIALEDFAQDEVGDFPAKWNTNASGEIIQLSGISSKFLKPANEGVFFPEFIDKLPELFTLEFDLYVTEEFSEMKSGLWVGFVEFNDRKTTHDANFSNVPMVKFDIHPVKGDNQSKNGSSSAFVIGTNQQELINNTVSLPWKVNQVNRVSFWRQKNRMRMYINDQKVWDLPRAFQPNITYGLLFTTSIWEGFLALSNLRLAVGAPDTRSKLITEGKFITNGILFDVNSDRIRPESVGVIKEIAQVLQENPNVTVKIIGHTDSDGPDAANLTLSQKRAAAVKNALANDFGIKVDRMQTDGKGETQPIDSNTTPQGKANNRRVEFIKL